MPRETQFRTLGDPPQNYLCTPLHALEASHLALEFVQLFGSTLAALLTNATDVEVDFESGAKIVLADGLQNLDRTTHDRMLMTLLKCVQVGGMLPDQNLGNVKSFNDHFDVVGLTAAYELFLWSAEVNFRSHFGVALSRLTARLAERAKTQVAPEAGTSSTSTP
jgi:hypothetical protein